jgi:hypothetical protein
MENRSSPAEQVAKEYPIGDETKLAYYFSINTP